MVDHMLLKKQYNLKYCLILDKLLLDYYMLMMNIQQQLDLNLLNQNHQQQLLDILKWLFLVHRLLHMVRNL